MFFLIVPHQLKPGESVKTMVHRVLPGGGYHPDGVREVHNCTDVSFGAGSVVRCAADDDGKWCLEITDHRVHAFEPLSDPDPV